MCEDLLWEYTVFAFTTIKVFRVNVGFIGRGSTYIGMLLTNLINTTLDRLI